jgi:hypothetical protein
MAPRRRAPVQASAQSDDQENIDITITDSERGLTDPILAVEPPLRSPLYSSDSEFFY